MKLRSGSQPQLNKALEIELPVRISQSQGNRWKQNAFAIEMLPFQTSERAKVSFAAQLQFDAKLLSQIQNVSEKRHLKALLLEKQNHEKAMKTMQKVYH